jgi:hypothetical protein
MRKCIVLLLITCLVVSSLIVLTITPATVQAVSKPSVPQFSVKLADNSYDVPPSTTTVTDPYTGKESIITTPGRHVVARTIVFTIKNQPFTPYNDGNHEINLYYVIQSKGYYEDWHGSEIYLAQSGSEEYTYWLMFATDYENGSKLNFRIEAVIGYKDYVNDPNHPILRWDDYEFINGVSSGWSDVQTITILGEATSSSPTSQTATWPPVSSEGNGQPQFPEQTQQPDSIFSNPFFMFGVGVLFASVVIVGVLVVLRRHIKAPTYTNNST